MIYGNVVRRYEESKGSSIWGVNRINEANAILEALQKEYDNYKNIVMNESYFSNDRELAIMEAKYEVIQEAVGVALVAAIIAVIGAIIGLLVMAIKLFGSGASAISSKMDTEKAKKLDSVDNNTKEKAAEKLEEVINNEGQEEETADTGSEDDSGTNTDVNRKKRDRFIKLDGLCFVDFRKIIRHDEARNFANNINKIKIDLNKESQQLQADVKSSRMVAVDICPEIVGKIDRVPDQIPTTGEIKSQFASYYSNNATSPKDCIRYATYVKAKEMMDKTIPASKDLCSNLQSVFKKAQSDVQEIKDKISKDIKITHSKSKANKLNAINENFVYIKKSVNYLKNFFDAWVWMEKTRLKIMKSYVVFCHKLITENANGGHDIKDDALETEEDIDLALGNPNNKTES